MDVQPKRGLLDVCMLAAIKNEDSYGYRIIKDMKLYIDLSESTLYTILKRLETSTGSIALSNVYCQGDAWITVSTGKVNLEQFSCNNLISRGDTGNIRLPVSRS